MHLIRIKTDISDYQNSMPNKQRLCGEETIKLLNRFRQYRWVKRQVWTSLNEKILIGYCWPEGAIAIA
jgi:hypothetical protein